MISGTKLILKPSNKAALGCFVLASALVADQVSKALVRENLHHLSDAIPILPGFNLVFVRNEGVTFGLLSAAPWWVLTAFAALISLWISSMLIRSRHTAEALACGLLLGGAFGNIADRIRFGGVTDFLDFYVGSYHWPSFNLADVAVVGGMSLLIFHIQRYPK